MLIARVNDLKVGRQRALGKVYALLIRLAEENENQITLSENSAAETAERVQQFPIAGDEVLDSSVTRKTEANDGK